MANFSISYIYQIKDKMSPTLKKISSEIKKQSGLFAKQARLINKNTLKENACTRSIMRATNASNKLNKSLRFTSDSVMNIAARAATIAFPVKRAMLFEDDMASIAKSAGFKINSEEYKEVAKSIKELSGTLPVNTHELAAITEQGAKLGMTGKSLIDFTKMTADAKVAFDMSADQAADDIAGIRARMSLDMKQTEGLLDLVNDLANRTSAKGDQILTILGRSSGTLKSLGISPDDAAKLAAMANIHIKSPERAATGLEIVFNRLAGDQKHGLGAAMQKDAVGTFNKLVKKFQAMDPEKRVGAMKDLLGDQGMRFMMKFVKGQNVTDDVNKAASGSHVGSMHKEALTMASTTSGVLTVLLNKLDSVAREIGDVFLDDIKDMARALYEYIDGVVSFIQNNREMVRGLIYAAGEFVMLGIQVRMIMAVMSALTVVLNLVTAAIGFVTTASKLFMIVWRMSPIGAVITLLTLLGGAIYALVAYFDPVIEKAKECWNILASILGLDGTTVEVSSETAMKEGDAGSNPTIKSETAITISGTNTKLENVETQGSDNTSRPQVNYMDAQTAQ